MELMAERWTDGRIDDLKDQMVDMDQRIDKRFERFENRMDEGFRELRAEMRESRRETNMRFDALDGRFDAMQRVLIVYGGSMFAAMMGLIAALVVTQS